MIKSEIAGGVVKNINGDILVVSQHGRTWSLPKGHVESGEDKQMAARREIAEESGVKQLTYMCDLGDYSRYKIAKDGTDDLSELKHITVFLFTTTDMDLCPTDPSNPEARWVKPEDVADLLSHPKDKEFWRSVQHLTV